MNNPTPMKRPWLKVSVIALGFLLLLELVLRLGLGFGTLPLYHKSLQYEYALSPGQELHRFGKRFSINEAGMRSEGLEAGEWRILKFGDSVLNGGLSTDQSELASSLLEEQLKAEFPERGLRVLNVSAGSWGPDNAYAWMQEYGHFDAQVVVLLFSSHDWQDQMSFQDVVGRVAFYPERQPLLAIDDALLWLWSRKFNQVDWASLPILEGASPEPQPFNPGWHRFASWSMQQEVPLLVYHHPTRSEWEAGRWNSEGEALHAYCNTLPITYISGLEAGYTADAWRDDIHPNEAGQRAIARALHPILSLIIE